MQVIILAVLTSLALCFSEQPHLGRRFAASMNLSASSIQAAVEAWQNDTMVVSQFLDTPSNASAYNGTDSSLMSSALNAYNHEIDEVSHKEVLDAFLTPLSISSVTTANTTLVTDGTFEIVVTGLQNLSDYGLSNISIISAINQDRCVRVLPAIDAYFAATASELNSGEAGNLSSPVPTLKAVRPSTCSAICAATSCTNLSPSSSTTSAGATAAGSSAQASAAATAVPVMLGSFVACAIAML